ncbi:hypothetical protein BN14_07734 [Rhizoctonia solani AG-1 IB]|uniref:Peptidase C14 caspase domain-containing protein n=1 Tax=Thanatephorus cucumeris (strain AG1-IB / isolate 7/3/14) TaxID=1108050 RepID=M5C2T2_THACB|nr:hypothetical protein BN14_07734 [Rhizoctonia solani AG-1 IB]
MPPRISILALKRRLKKLRIKRKPNSSKKQVIGQSSDADVDNKKDDAQSESFGGLYALIIGINSYPSLNPLKGAVSDADDMANFLMADLGISPGRIVNLRNQEATRKRIIEELQDLWKNPRISPGAPILIYYAGHGSPRIY